MLAYPLSVKLSCRYIGHLMLTVTSTELTIYKTDGQYGHTYIHTYTLYIIF